MMATRFALIGVCAASLALASCSQMGGNDAKGFQANYFAARSALESGNYKTAVSHYDAMIDSAGPLETRLRLEKAHALLRADSYALASQEAAFVAAAHQDNRRAAALAVVGTAEHRIAQEAMSTGDFGPTTVAHLRKSDAALTEMLAKAPDLDPLGSMAGRLEMVKAALANLG